MVVRWASFSGKRVKKIVPTWIRIITQRIFFRDDFQQGYHSARPIWAKIHPDIAAPGTFEKYIEETGEECKQYQTCVPFTRAFAQKPPLA